VTDAELRDAAVAHLKQTTTGYLKNNGDSKPPPWPANSTHWGPAMDLLAQIGGATPPPSTEPAAIAGKGYRLVFEEQFTGPLDPTRWTMGAWQGYQSTPATDAVVSNGTLKIHSRRADGYPHRNISTRIGPSGSRASSGIWKFGYFEMRSKWPAGKGSWPAFWLFSENWVWKGIVPPYVSEIDILEAAGGLYLDKYNHVVHRNTSSPGGVQDVFAPTGAGQFAGPNVGNLTTGFHTYGVLWTPSEVTFYSDDIRLASTTPFDSTGQEMFVILSMWVGKSGAWVGAYDSTTPDPLTHEIDYVRIYQPGIALRLRHRFARPVAPPVALPAAAENLYGLGDELIRMGPGE